MTKKYLKQCLLVFGLFLSSSLLYGQQTLKSLQEVQFLSQNQCVVIQVNADWNIGSSIDLGKMKNCVWFNASIDNKEYGAVIASEWKIVSVPTIIMFEKGKEIKRFEAGLSFKLNADDIKKAIEKEIDNILLRRFQ
jgi:thioredoxin-like negative regulator of GroEL|tara:strand:+ start:5295 stop:5702 length:408 start_codon:yes stop_codon:yes gene_type:complete